MTREVLKIVPVLDPAEECRECDGIGSRQCNACRGEGTTECECCDCGDCHDRDCSECDGDGRWTCDVCHGWACMVAARAWEREQVLPRIPSDVLRLLLSLAPRLDAGGLPRFSVRTDGTSARPVITVETRCDDAEAEAALCGGGWIISKLSAAPERPTYRAWSWRGDPVRLDVRTADRGVQ